MERDIIKKARRPSSPSTASKVRLHRGGEGPLSRAQSCVARSAVAPERVLRLVPAAALGAAVADARLTVHLRVAHAESRHTYGRSRLQRALAHPRPAHGDKRVRRLMRVGAIAGSRASTLSSHDGLRRIAHPVMANHLARPFAVAAAQSRLGRRYHRLPHHRRLVSTSPSCSTSRRAASSGCCYLLRTENRRPRTETALKPRGCEAVQGPAPRCRAARPLPAWARPAATRRGCQARSSPGPSP